MYKTTVYQWRIMYIWGTPVTISEDVYKWVMRCETREQRFKRALKVYFKRKKEGRLCLKSMTSGYHKD